MKKDFRVQYPLWQIVFLVMITFGVSASGGGGMSDLLLALNVTNPEEFEWIIALFYGVLFIGLGITFRIKLSTHNKNNPSQKLAFFQLKPFEYIEDDEGWQFITRRAAQKVYSFLTAALMLSLLIHLWFHIPRYGVVINILLLAIMQYLIYYLEIRKFAQEGIAD